MTTTIMQSPTVIRSNTSRQGTLFFLVPSVKNAIYHRLLTCWYHIFVFWIENIGVKILTN